MYQLQESDIEKDEKYQLKNKIGKGTFGVVYSVICKENNEQLVVKQVYQDIKYKNRELSIIQMLDHPCIIKMKDHYYTKKSKDDLYLNIVMDHIPYSLFDYIENLNQSMKTFQPQLIQLFTYQMFRSIAYLKGKQILHRDIKPHNFLIDLNKLQLYLCDFGSAKVLSKDETNISYICSRYYRAPELIFGSVNYTNAIDVWSCGCVFAEMILQKPLFKGDSAIQQILEIIKRLGTPTQEEILQMNPNNASFQFPIIQSEYWDKLFEDQIDQQGLDLISKILIYDPSKRLTPLQILQHKYFDQIKSQGFKINGSQIPDLYDFTEEELSEDVDSFDLIIPEWQKIQLRI